MLIVRQSLTEILLEVTNEEIRCVAKEMKQRYQKKSRCRQTPEDPVRS